MDPGEDKTKAEANAITKRREDKLGGWIRLKKPWPEESAENIETTEPEK